MIRIVLILVGLFLFWGCDDCSDCPQEVLYDTIYLDTLHIYDTIIEYDTIYKDTLTLFDTVVVYDTIYKDSITIIDTIFVEEKPSYSSPIYLYQNFGSVPTFFYFKKDGVYSMPSYPGDLNFRYSGGRKYWYLTNTKYKMLLQE